MKEFSCLEHCPHPGKCCFAFTLSGGRVETEEDAEKFLADNNLSEWFRVVGSRDPGGVRNLDPSRRHWMYGCRKVQSNGTCGDYENRPQLCRDFFPASDPLCVVTPEHLEQYGLFLPDAAKAAEPNEKEMPHEGD